MRAALVIGINRYPGAPLQGCVADATYTAAMLQQRGFTVVTLFDEAATSLAMKRGIGALAGQLRSPGDVGVVCYSGHGTQVRDLDGDEPDHLDEAVCPVDFSFSDTSTWLTDDFVRRTVENAALPAGVSLLFHLDSCHAGTMLRPFPASSLADGHPPTVRRLMPPEAMLAAPLVSRFRRVFNLGLARRVFGARLLRSQTKAEVALLAATKATQLAADAYINGGYHGADTWAMQVALEKLGNPTLAELRAEMQTWLDARGYGGKQGQTPTLYGSVAMRRRPFLAAGA